MNQILKTSLIVLAVLVVTGALFLGGAFVGSQWFGRASFNSPAYGPGMMNRGNPGQDQPAPGHRNAPGQGMMGAGPDHHRDQDDLTPVTVDEAKTAAQTYLTALKIDGLEIGDVTILNAGAYVVVKETAGGNGAFELIVDPHSKTAHPAGGPSVMWNLKYGGVLHAAMMADRHDPGQQDATPVPAATSAALAATPADVSADMPLSAEQAVAHAQAFLDKAIPGATAAAAPLKFYGYYSLSFSKDGTTVGILSVNGFNGDVLPAGPHGPGMKEPR